jgi:hypothetical protein
MPANAFLWPVVAVYEGGVGRPWLGRLEFELLAAVVGANALRNGVVDCFLYAGFDFV